MTPDHRTLEERAFAALEQMAATLLEIRDSSAATLLELRKSNEPQTPTIDTEPVLGLARKPGSAIVKPKGRR